MKIPVQSHKIGDKYAVKLAAMIARRDPDGIESRVNKYVCPECDSENYIRERRRFGATTCRDCGFTTGYPNENDPFIRTLPEELVKYKNGDDSYLLKAILTRKRLLELANEIPPSESEIANGEIEAANRKAIGDKKPIVRETKYQGIPICVETDAGQYRHWSDAAGNTGKTKMIYPYGYIKMTTGYDQDELDCYIGPDATAQTVFVVHQNDPATGQYDEDKVMLGFPDIDAAATAYLAHYDNPAFLGEITPIRMDDFQAKLGFGWGWGDIFKAAGDWFQKAFAPKDISKLTKKTIVDKDGIRRTVYVRNELDEQAKHEGKKIGAEKSETTRELRKEKIKNALRAGLDILFEKQAGGSGWRSVEGGTEQQADLAREQDKRLTDLDKKRKESEAQSAIRRIREAMKPAGGEPKPSSQPGENNPPPATRKPDGESRFESDDPTPRQPERSRFESDDIHKAFSKRDLSKLTRRQIIDKNGHRQTVWVRTQKDYQSQKRENRNRAIENIKRNRPMDYIEFDPPISGKNGSKITGYFWAYKWEVDESDQMKQKRKSDWAAHAINPNTGRKIVHQFTVKKPGHDEIIVSAETAIREAGITDAKILTGANSIVKTQREIEEMKKAIMENEKSRYEKYIAENPEITVADLMNYVSIDERNKQIRAWIPFTDKEQLRNEYWSYHITRKMLNEREKLHKVITKLNKKKRELSSQITETNNNVN